jgi:hypothetical protein
MIRALSKCFIFAVFGPSLGLLSFLVIGRGSAKDLSPDTSAIALLFVYLNGMVPALMTAAFDGYLDRKVAKGISKWLLTGSFGYAAAYVNVLAPMLIYQPKWGLVGAIPALICSAISDQMTSRTTQGLRA